MITVSVERTKDHQIRSFTISGHAESGPYGYDLVCAAVSAVSFGTINSILTLCTDDLHIEQAGEEGGFLYVKVPNLHDKNYQNNIQLLLEGMIISLQTIERDYSEHIKIKDR